MVMIDQSTGCDFGQDGYIAISLCCDIHDAMTKNSRNRNSSSNMSTIMEEKMLDVCLSPFLFLLCISIQRSSTIVNCLKVSIVI
jgi:hypothetical protein